MLEFSWRSEPDWVIFSANDLGRPVTVESWQAVVGPAEASTVARLWASVENEEALADGYELHLPWKKVAELTPGQRRVLKLPGAPDVTLSVRNNGTIDQNIFSLDYAWLRTNGQPIVLPSLDGPFLKIGSKEYLLPSALYEIVAAIDRFNSIPASRPDDRAAAWVDVQSLLPASDQPSPDLSATKYLKETRIAYAGAFTLYPSEKDGNFDFDPVLFAKKPETAADGDEAALDDEDPAPLLPPAYQDYFASSRFRNSSQAKGRYVLKDGWILVLSPDLKRAMEIVRKAQVAGGEIAREFVKNPRGYLKGALGDELDDHLIDNLFKETREYSERVQGIGLWQKKVIPWVQIAREPWLPPTAIGLVIDGAPVPFKPEVLPELIGLVHAAIQRGDHEVTFNGVTVPATPESLAALENIRKASGEIGDAEPSKAKDGGGDVEDPETPAERQALIVKNNFDAVVFNSDPAPRSPHLPHDLHQPLLKTTAKPHQLEGISWLQQCWQVGWTGALLADDMGLGKTFQALAFLAWISEAMREGRLPRAPILIVAPTGLLRNWGKEINLHLNHPGLGHIEKAYDASLKSLRIRSGSESTLGEPLLDLRRLREADCVLTTYETLRDYQFSFGQIPFSVIVYDEVQKIKTPGTQITDAAKAMNARFVLALTGTPIENRLADLWCIMDTLHPGALGDLRDFSPKYEVNAKPEDLAGLKNALTVPGNGRPAVMLRRMKEEVLDALPPKENFMVERLMPAVQANAYAAVVNEARNQSGQGKMLEALQKMRQVSLAPTQRAMLPSDEAYLNSSARLVAAIEILEEIKARDEKVLIFVEYREAQAELSGILQRRFKLKKAPMIIAGNVSGAQRQDRVDEFQKSEVGFDIMLLSPKAGGVGITLTAANNVIHLTRWWNPAVEDQSTDRCYRIGQTRPVNVYYPIAVVPTEREHSFDIRLHALLESKRELSRNMLLPVGGSIEDARKLYEETTLAN